MRIVSIEVNKMGFINEKDENGNWRTIDKDRDIILHKTGGPHPDTGYEFELTYKGKKIRIRGENKGRLYMENGKNTNKSIMIWEFYEMYMLEDLRPEQKTIQDIIAEALKVYGAAARQEKAHSVTVEFKL